MRVSQLFGKTLRQEPGEAETVSHRLLLKSGIIAPLASGLYSILPLGWRVLQKIQHIVREELDAAGAQELLMPALQPLEIWEESGRADAYGPVLFRLQDRKERDLVLGPTHEEVITSLVRQHVRSYRDLPLRLYQIQTKFRDEPRPRGGLLRVREFIMKDMYSFDADQSGLDESYKAAFQAYKRIFSRCGLRTLPVEADSGAIGGKDSQEFILVAESGEDVILHCRRCEYAANVEKAEFIKPQGQMDALLPLEEVLTPGQKTIEEVADFLKVPKARTLKAVFYAADGQIVFVVIRGDLEVNEVKLRNLLRCTDLRLATDDEVRAAGLVAGYASPLGLTGIKTVADDSIGLGSNFVAGANKPGYHMKNLNYPRDFQVDALLDIARAQEGHGCPRCRSPLAAARGIEVGHVFKLGTFYSQKLGAVFLDRDGAQKPTVMGCYGIGVGRLMAAAVEQNHDDKGIIWPSAIAPFQAHLVALAQSSAEVQNASDHLYQELQHMGLEVLYDDREETAGVKFNDADLLGLPVRITISQRTLRQEAAEIKRRTESKAMLLPLDQTPAKAQDLLAG